MNHLCELIRVRDFNDMWPALSKLFIQKNVWVIYVMYEWYNVHTKDLAHNLPKN